MIIRNEVGDYTPYPTLYYQFLCKRQDVSTYYCYYIHIKFRDLFTDKSISGNRIVLDSVMTAAIMLSSAGNQFLSAETEVSGL